MVPHAHTSAIQLHTLIPIRLLTASRAMSDGDLEPRIRDVEMSTRVHEAVCAERYKAINLRLNVIMAGLGIVLAAIAAGDPLVGLLRSMAGVH